MTPRTRLTAAIASIALAVTGTLAVAPAVSATPTSSITLSADSGGPLYVQFETGYQTWLQPGWSFGPNVKSFRLYAQQCVRLVSDAGTTIECNFAQWNPISQAYQTVTLPDGLTSAHRYNGMPVPFGKR